MANIIKKIQVGSTTYDIQDAALTTRVTTAEGNITTLQANVTEMAGEIGTLQTDVAGKVNKEEGKGLSTNDYDNTEKALVHGAQQGKSYANYSTMVTALNSLAKDTLNVGQSIYIQTTEVPDVWVYSQESSKVTYTYTTDAQLIADLAAGAVQMGYYKIAKLETAKVVLDGYKTKQSEVPDPSASGTSTTFIASISQNENGEITVTKKTAVDTQYTEGTGIDITNKVVSIDSALVDNTLSSSNKLATVSTVTNKVGEHAGSNIAHKDLFDAKQDALTPGDNITIIGNLIDAIDTKYTAGTNVTIDASNKISATDTKYTAGTNITIDSSNKISAQDTTYTADHGVKIVSNVIKLDDAWIDGTVSTSNQLLTATSITGKQDKLTPGTNITINGTTISATDTNTTYAAGTAITITGASNAINLDTSYVKGTLSTSNKLVTENQFSYDSSTGTLKIMG